MILTIMFSSDFDSYILYILYPQYPSQLCYIFHYNLYLVNIITSYSILLRQKCLCIHNSSVWYAKISKRSNPRRFTRTWEKHRRNMYCTKSRFNVYIGRELMGIRASMRLRRRWTFTSVKGVWALDVFTPTCQ